MKSFLYKALILAIPCLVFLSIIEWKLRSLPNDYTFKKEYLDNHSSEIKTLVLGSSLSWRGLNPDYLGENAYNSAFSGQSFKYDEYILDRYSSQLTNLEDVILTVFYPSFEFEKNDLLSNLDKYYSVFFDYGNPTILLNIYNGSQIFKQFNKAKKDPNAFIHSKANGYRLKNSRLVGTLQKNAERMAMYHRADFPAERAKNIEHLNKIIAICNKLNADLHLVIHPANHHYLKGLDSIQVNRMRTISSDFESQNANVHVLDLFEDKSFLDENFFDGIHLNDSGAKKMSKMVRESIKNKTR